MLNRDWQGEEPPSTQESPRVIPARAGRRMSFSVTSIYVVIAALWILVSDRLVAIFEPDAQHRLILSMAKGWVFVAVTAALLYFLLRRESQQWAKERQARNEAERAMQANASRQRLLLEASRLAGEAADEEHELSVALMRLLGGPLGAQSCFHFRLEGDRLVLIAGIGAQPQFSSQIQNVPLNGTFAGQSVLEKRTIQADAQSIAASSHGHLGRVLGATAAVALPLMARDGSVLGAFTFTSRVKQRFSPDDISLLEIVSRFVAVSTERMRAMAALRIGENRYRLLAENTADVIWVMDFATKRFTYVSPSVVRLRGITAEQAMGETLEETLTPHSWDLVSRAMAERIESYASGDPNAPAQTFEVEVWRADKTTVWTEIVTTVIRTPEGLRVVGVSRDISERRKMEQKMRAQEALVRETTKMAHIGGWDFDPATGEGAWTEETARIHDIDPSESTNVAKGLSFYDEKSRPLITAAVRDAVERGIPYDLELEITTATGRRKWVRTVGHPIIENGKVVRMRGTMQDVTDKRRAALFAEGQKQVLEMIVNGKPLIETLQALAFLTEAQCDGMMCSVMLVDETGTRLMNGSSPRLPARYIEAVNGIAVGPCAGSCGTAGWRKETVVVEDIDSDPLWAPFRDLARAHGLKACWSTPILGHQRELLGTFALYFNTPRKRDAAILAFSELSTHTASVAINRERFERALKASEAQFRAVVESAPEAIFIQTEGRFGYVNPQAVRLFGAESAAQLVGHPVLDRLHPDYAEVARERIRLLNESKIAAPTMVQCFLKMDGGAMFAEVSAVPFLFGGINGALVFARDVTERRQAEQRLHFHQDILRETGHIAKVGGWIYEPGTGKVIWTEEVARIHELSMSDQPVTADTALRYYDDDSRRRVEAAMEESVRNGKPYDLELQLLAANGGRKWVRTIGHPVFENGRVVRLHGSFQDITERKKSEAALLESEARFRQVVENIEEVFWVTDASMQTMLYVSPAYEKIWGRPIEEILTNPTSWFDTIHEDDRERVTAARMKQADGTYNETYRIKRPDGKLRWIHERAFPVREKSGAPYRVVGTALDITEHRNLEMQLRQAQKMEAIGTLAGGIAHDFNNILGAIMGYTDLAKLDTVSSTAKSSLDEVTRACKRASDLVRQILTFSRQQEHKRQPLQLWRVVDEAARLLRAALPSTIQFDVVLSKQAPAVLADSTQIHQVVMNLCTNAAHAMEGKQGLLGLRLEPFEANWEFVKLHAGSRVGLYACLTVSDNGIGMDQATLERIYEPFFTTKKPGEGTGLGLSVVHGVVQNHDGVITVQSGPGKGTIFRLYFPAYEGTEIQAVESFEKLPRGAGEKILVVDDEEALAQITGKMLAKLGYAPQVAVGPRDALAKILNGRDVFHLVMTDLTMPGMTGIELAGEVAKHAPGTPLVLMTGYFSRRNHDAIEAAGIKDVLMKPVDMGLLAETVHRMLRKEKVVGK